MTVYAAAQTLLQLGDGATPEKFTTIGEIFSITGPSMSVEMVEATDLSDSAKDFVCVNVTNGGEVTFEVNFDEDDTTQASLITKLLAGTENNYQLCFPDVTAIEYNFQPGDVNAGADQIDPDAGGNVTLTMGQPVQFSTDAADLPDGLEVGVTYFYIYGDANTGQVAVTNANAVAGAPVVDIVDGGTGNHKTLFGTRYDFAATVTSAEPSGAVQDKLSGSITLKITGTVTKQVP